MIKPMDQFNRRYYPKRYGKIYLYVWKNGKIHRLTPEEIGKQMAERTLEKVRKSAQQSKLSRRLDVAPAPKVPTARLILGR